ncbi:PREDICTED: coiled-coil domain-containing protein 15 isoform X3 [Bison bison bison]|uniref:Coiled-coil domain-containing protein 15 isoform X3 n=1 Tax=Bison bison bison TaxID=43346 RepID=A0A6P3G7N2_BISBB|nr:PREDICTED: coiled-coil domain-containing protein 15 isoform X3 [Bison bison bison]
MPRSMAPLKKPRNTSKLPLALNPLKSKNVLAVLAERNQAIVPVGAWVEPAPPDSSEVPAATSAYIIEEELKEQLRKKQEALKRFQRQVKSRVNQQIRLRKKQQLQRSYEAAEKEGSIAMYSSDPAHLTPKRTSVFPSNLNAAIGRARLPPPQMLEGRIEDRENQSELFQQQAQALSQSMKQARHRLASFKTVNQKDAPEFPDDRKKSFPTQEKALCRKPSFTRINIGVRGELPLEVHQGLLTPADYQKFMDDQEPEESSSVMIDKKGKKHLSWGDQEALFPEDKDIPFSRVQKVQFKTPLFDVIEEEEVKQLHQDVLPEAQDYLPEAQGDLTSVLDVEWEAQRCEPRLSTQHIDLEGHTVEPKAQAIKTKTKSCILKDQTVGLEDGDIALEVQDFPLQNQTFLPTDQHILPKDQNIQPECQDQDFLPSDQKSKCIMQPSCFKKSELGRGIASGVWLHRNFGQASHNVTDERWREELFLEHCECVVHEIQDPVSAREKSLCSIQQPCVGTAERWQEDLLLDGHHHLAPKQQREASSRKQVGDEYQSRLNTEFQTPLALQSGVSQEEDKKERQKQYLRYRRLFMDIEREQVKEQQRQKEHKKKIEKIKKKKEQQRYAEEQRILRMKSHKEPCSGEKMSEILAQLQLEEIKGAREKQQQKEKEYQRYVEALRAQIQEKMQLYNITLPPLCCCGPDFWDAHPDTCANNCIFYKNHKAYTRALHSVVNSCDIPEGNSDLRVAIHNFASAHRRTLKNL